MSNDYEIPSPPSRFAYKISEAAYLLNYSETHLYELRAEGKLRFIGAGKGARIPLAEINRLIREGIERDAVENNAEKRKEYYRPRIEKRQKTLAAKKKSAA